MAVWVRRRDTDHEFDQVAYQDALRVIPSPPLTPALLEACERAVHVINSDGNVLRAGRATLFILERTGWGYGILPRVLARPPFIWFTELGYAMVARNRSFFSRFLFRESPKS